MQDNKDLLIHAHEYSALAMNLMKLAVRDSSGPTIAVLALSVAAQAMMHLFTSCLRSQGLSDEEAAKKLMQTLNFANEDAILALLEECQKEDFDAIKGVGSFFNPRAKS